MNLMKIIKRNTKRADCGVVAAFNASSWCNKQRDYKEVERLAKASGYSLDNGMYSFQLSLLLNKLQLPYKKVKLNINEIQSRLMLGRFFILKYRPTDWYTGHVLSVFLNREGKIRLINADDQRMTWDEFAAEAYAGCVKFEAYEFPNRKML